MFVLCCCCFIPVLLATFASTVVRVLPGQMLDVTGALVTGRLCWRSGCGVREVGSRFVFLLYCVVRCGTRACRVRSRGRGWLFVVCMYIGMLNTRDSERSCLYGAGSNIKLVDE